MAAETAQLAGDAAVAVAHVAAADIGWLERQTLAQVLRAPQLPFRQFLFAYSTRSSPHFDDLPARPIHAPSRLPVLRALALQRAMSDVVLQTGVRHIILHAWSPKAARWCGPLIDDDHRLVVQAPWGSDAPRSICWPRSGRLHHTPAYVCPNLRAIERLRANGVPAERCTLVRPSPPRAAAPRGEAATLRERLGLEADAIVALVLPPITRTGGAFNAVWAGMLVEKVYPTLRMVVPSAGSETARIGRLVRSVRHEQLTRFAPPDVDLVELLAIADVAIYVPTGESPATAAMLAAEAGVPLVASSTADVLDVLPNGAAARLCAPGNVREAGRALLAVLDALPPGVRLRRDIAAAQPPARLESQYSAVYRAIAEDLRAAGG